MATSGAGRAAPKAAATQRFTVPAARPLMQAILTESPAEILRVRLLSSAQHKQAPATASAGQEVAISPDCQPRITPPQTIRDIPNIRRRSKFSRNTNQARRAVNTLSRFSNSDTEIGRASCRERG